MAENIVGSLSRGAAVIAAGRLQCRTWETKEGDKRATVELTVDDIGPSLRRNVAKVTKVTRERADGGNTARPAADTSVPATAGGADPWATPAPVPAAIGDDSNPPF
jgi:single-strand DNA-binding protein